MNCWAGRVNKNFVVFLKTKILTEGKFWFANFSRIKKKWSTKQQSPLVNRNSQITNLNPVITVLIYLQIASYSNTSKTWSRKSHCFTFSEKWSHEPLWLHTSHFTSHHLNDVHSFNPSALHPPHRNIYFCIDQTLASYLLGLY